MGIIHNFHGARNGVVHCTCNRTYCATDADDALDHARHHAEIHLWLVRGRVDKASRETGNGLGNCFPNCRRNAWSLGLAVSSELRSSSLRSATPIAARMSLILSADPPSPEE